MVFPSASGSSSRTCSVHCLTGYLRGTLCSSVFSPSAALLFPVNSSCLGFSRLPAWWSQLMETTRLCRASLSLCHSLGACSKQSAGAVTTLTLVVSCLGSLSCVVYYTVSWVLWLHVFHSDFLVVWDGKINMVLVTPSWLEVEGRPLIFQWKLSGISFNIFLIHEWKSAEQ